MIRAATVDDLPAIMYLAEPVWSEIQPGFPVHHATAAATLRNLITSPDGLVAVLYDGAIFGGVVGHVSPGLWSRGMQAVSTLRWVDPARRGRWGHVLVRHFEQWAQERGARVMGVSQTGREATAYYERLGYAPAEMMFWKAI